jgi:hypothetical protein
MKEEARPLSRAGVAAAGLALLGLSRCSVVTTVRAVATDGQVYAAEGIGAEDRETSLAAEASAVHDLGCRAVRLVTKGDYEFANHAGSLMVVEGAASARRTPRRAASPIR